MIYVTGDLHGAEELKRFSTDFIKFENNDTILQLGDAGIIWYNSNNKFYAQENYWLNWFEKNKKGTNLVCVLGNHCFSKDTEVLTEFGWYNIQKLHESALKYRIAEFDIENNNNIVFSYSIKKMKEYSESIIDFVGKDTNFSVTPFHRIIYKKNKIYAKDLLSSFNVKDNDFIYTGNSQNIGIEIEDNWIRLLVWVIMDGTLVDLSKYAKDKEKSIKRRVQFKLSRKEKIENISNLLDCMNIPYTIKKATMSGVNKLQPYIIRIYGDYARKIFTLLNNVKRFPLSWKNVDKRQLHIILQTIILTDGTKLNGTIVWRTIDKNNVDILQESCIKNNYIFKFHIMTDGSGFKKNCRQYICRIFYNNKQKYSYVKIKENNTYKDYVYCFEMPLGTIVTRLNGKVSFNGNCNFSRIYSEFPIIDFNGAKFYQIRKNIYFVKHGEIFTIENKKFFVFGGASSVDKDQRIEGKSWWREEEASYMDQKLALENLTKHKNKVDYILTHTAPKSIMEDYFGIYDRIDSTSRFLEEVKNDIQFTRWYFGHFHKNISLNDKFTCLWQVIEELK